MNSNILAAVIYPLLRQLEGEFIEVEDNHKTSRDTDVLGRNREEDRRKLSDIDIERDEECGICMENSAKMVLPNCGHSLCISCFHDWYFNFRICYLLLLYFLLEGLFAGAYFSSKIYLILDRNVRSQSCPFCRDSLKRVRSRDLWVLINNVDFIDKVALAKENLRRFYLNIESLPLAMPEAHAILFDYMI